MTTKDYLYSNNIDTDLLVVIGGLIVILFLMMLIMYFINSLRHKELTEILTKISFPEKNPGAICLNRRRSAVICCPCVCWHRYSVHPESWLKFRGRSSWRVRRKLHGRRGAVVLMATRAENITWAIHRSLLPISMISSIKRPVFLLTVAVFMNRTQFWITVNGYAFYSDPVSAWGDWSEVLRLTDIVTEKVSSGRTAGGHHHRHTGYTGLFL